MSTAPWILAVAATLVGCGSPPENTADAGVSTDAGLDTAPGCTMSSAPLVVAVDPCLDLCCFAPTLALAARSDRFLVAYSKNQGWWATDVFAQVLDPTGAQLSAGELDISGVMNPDPGRPMMGASEPPVVVAWLDGWLVAWQDAMAAAPMVAAARLDATGGFVWQGSRWQRADGSTFVWVGTDLIAGGVLDGPSAGNPLVALRDTDLVLARWDNAQSHAAYAPATNTVIEVAVVQPNGAVSQQLDVAPNVGPEALAASPDVIAVLWGDSSAVSPDGGTRAEPALWGRLVRGDLTTVTTDPLPIFPGPYESSRATMAWDGAAFVVAWQDYRSGNDDIYAARLYSDGTLSPDRPVQVTRTPGPSQSPALAPRSGDLVLVWQEAAAPWLATGDGGFGGFSVLLARSFDGGLTWTEPLTVATDAGANPSPRVAVAGESIGVAWLQDDPAGVQVRFVPVACQ